MPLLAAVGTLGAGFLPLFDPGIESVPGAADAWARAYYLYVSQGGPVVVAPVKRTILASDLSNAFDPKQAGGGESLFMTALAKFWIGIVWPPPPPTGAVISFTPSRSVSMDLPESATPQEQANALADIIHQLTVTSALVGPPTGGFVT